MNKRKRNKNEQDEFMNDKKKQKVHSRDKESKLERTETIVAQLDDNTANQNKTSTLIRRTSSLVANDDSLETELSHKSQAKLEKTLSSILMPSSNSASRITIQKAVNFDVCTDFKLNDNFKSKNGNKKGQQATAKIHTNEDASATKIEASFNDQSTQEQLYSVADVPLEIWVDILLRVPNVDRWHMAQTSQRFYQIFKYYVGYDKLVYFSYNLYALCPSKSTISWTGGENEEEEEDAKLTTNCFEFVNSADYRPMSSYDYSSIVLFGSASAPQVTDYIDVDILVIYKQQQEIKLPTGKLSNNNVPLSSNKPFGTRFCKTTICGWGWDSSSITPDNCYPYWTMFPHLIEKVFCLNAESINNIDDNLLLGYKKYFEHLSLRHRRPVEEVNNHEIFKKAFDSKDNEKEANNNKRLQKLEECSTIPTTTIESTSSVQFVYKPKPADFCVKVNHILHTRQMRNKIFRNELTDKDKFTILHLARTEAFHAGKSIQWPNSYHGLSNSILPQPQTIKLKLYEYQLRGLAWMKQIEEDAMKREYSFSVVIRGPASLDFFMKSGPFSDDLLPANLQIVDPKDSELQDGTNNDLVDSFKVRGGMLADEMGYILTCSQEREVLLTTYTG